MNIHTRRPVAALFRDNELTSGAGGGGVDGRGRHAHAHEPACVGNAREDLVEPHRRRFSDQRDPSRILGYETTTAATLDVHCVCHYYCCLM
jgi:hypothetical protein